MADRIIISNSRRKEDYEILIKQRYDKGFMAYCPQINRLVKGESFEAVHLAIDALIEKHIKLISPESGSL